MSIFPLTQIDWKSAFIELERIEIHTCHTFQHTKELSSLEKMYFTLLRKHCPACIRLVNSQEVNQWWKQITESKEEKKEPPLFPKPKTSNKKKKKKRKEEEESVNSMK